MQRNIRSRGRNRKAILVSMMGSDVHALRSLIPSEVLENTVSNVCLFPKQIRANEGNGQQETVVTKEVNPFSSSFLASLAKAAHCLVGLQLVFSQHPPSSDQSPE